MKRYSIAAAAFALAACMIIIGEAALFSARTRRGLESLANAVNSGDPALLDGYAGALISAAPSSKEAEAGRLALAERGYSSFPVDRFNGRLFSDGVMYCVLGAAFFMAGGAALFILIDRRVRIKREMDLSSRISSALRGDAPFVPKRDEERAFARLFAEIDRANALRSSSAAEMREYAENVAHEIKSPASGILLNLDLMESSGVSAERLSSARKCAVRIDAYTAGLLSLARLRAGKVRMEFEPADLGELASETAAELEANGIRTVVSGEGTRVNCDRVRVKEAIRNLIVNAAKHQEGADSVRVELASTEYDASVLVKDSGPGIRDGALIERYSVGNDDGTSFGIGLSLAWEVASRHSGKLVIKNPDKGGAIELILPRYSLKTSIAE